MVKTDLWINYAEGDEGILEMFERSDRWGIWGNLVEWNERILTFRLNLEEGWMGDFNLYDLIFV